MLACCAVPKRLLDQRWPWLAAAVVIVLVFLSTFVDLRMPGTHWDPRPVGTADDIARLRERGDTNVLFILIDTLRSEHLGSYGYARDTSPTLDRLGASGVRFARQIAQSSWTKASMASLWTSLHPARTGITRFDHVLPDDPLMPAEILQKAGFKTIGLYRNGWVAPTFGFSQGFDVYQHPHSPFQPVRESPTITETSTDEGAVEAALEFLRINGSKRWFLYMHLMDVHEYIYDLDSALFGTDHVAIYDNSIRHTDSVIGVFLDYLAEDGYLDKTVIVIAADHGEAFGERGYDGHAREVFRETTEVPFIVSFPFRLEPGIVVRSHTSNVDVMPTLLDLIGLSAAPGVDGRSRVPEILAIARGEAPPAADHTVIAQLDQNWGRPGVDPQNMVAVLDDEYRYVRVDQHSGRIEQIFDYREDPAEMRDRLGDKPDGLANLQQIAETYLGQQPPWGSSPRREINELELNQLRALGYALPAAHAPVPRKKIDVRR
jgi:choline-sulfatase